jgi:deoxyribodipyrimidine photolyase-related protein
MQLTLILADQLTPSLASLKALDRSKDMVLMAEVGEEASYVPHHPQKIALLFSAMRHFAQSLREAGWRLHYHRYDPTQPRRSLLSVLSDVVAGHDITAIVMTHCGEYRLHQTMRDEWQPALGVPVHILDDDRFLCSLPDFQQWAQDRNNLRLEYFYRTMRRRTGLLMTGLSPAGGEWNFDQGNRKPWRGQPAPPPPLTFTRDSIDEEVLSLVNQHFSHHAGSIESFLWATTREQALQALDYFIAWSLPAFGDYQDAMAQHQPWLFHSLLSPYLNCGLLTPLEVCQAAEAAWHAGSAPLNAVEGFIRQILGWREYVRGIYWLLMPQYRQNNQLAASRNLPSFYWTGKTRMNCMAQSIGTSLQYGYAHHIQRLMVTGNFALLADIKPEQVCEWYLAIYADAYEWVELPNTLGMALHADGGVLGSKPYAASGNYIHKMSDYCRHCHYDVKTATEHDSCPFNSLYWHFIDRHREDFASNPRMSMVYRNLERMSGEKRAAVMARAASLLETIEIL